MLIMIICTMIICLIIGVHFTKHYSSISLFDYVFWGMLMGCFPGIVIACLLPATIITTRVETSSEQRIVSLKDTNGIDGDFFLGSGSLSNSLKYFMYVKSEHGGMHMSHVPVSNTIIFEKDQLKHHGILRSYEQKLPESLRLWMFARTKYRYEIFVPNDTIIKQMKLDLQ